MVNLLFSREMNGEMDEMNDMLCLKLSLLSYICLHFICPIYSSRLLYSVLLCASPFSPRFCVYPNLVVEVVCRVGFPTHPCLSVVLLMDCCLDAHSQLVARRLSAE